MNILVWAAKEQSGKSRVKASSAGEINRLAVELTKAMLFNLITTAAAIQVGQRLMGAHQVAVNRDH